MQSTPPRRYQQLQPEDRVTLASLVQQKYTVRDIALVLGRSPSTISRELRRNAQPTGYASTTARACAQRRRLQGRPLGKLHRDGILFGVMRHFLSERWSPQQIALTLACIFPKGHEHRESHETIYNCIYAQPVGELKRELIATLQIIQSGEFPRARLRGSWAGAMGQTQFIPTTFLSTAVDEDGDGRIPALHSRL